MHDQSKSLVPIFVLTAAMSLGYGSVIALLAEIRDEFGFTDAQVGLIAFAGFTMGFVAQVGLARLADRGYASLMVRGGIVLAAAGAGWTIFADELWQWVGARLLLGLGSGAVGPAVRRIVISRDPAQVGANLGKQASFDVGGFVVGPLVAAGLHELFGLRAPFVTLAAVYVVLFMWSLRVDLNAGEARRTPRVVRALLARPAMQSALCASVAFYLTIGMFEALWALLLDDLGAGTTLIGVTLSLFTVPMVLFAPFGGKIAQRRGPLNVVTFSILAATACTFAYGFLPLWPVLLVSIVHACADSFTMPGNQVAVALSTPSDQLAAGQGLLGATGLAVAGLSALFGAQLYDSGGREVVFSVTAALMLVFVVLARWRGRELGVALVAEPSTPTPLPTG